MIDPITATMLAGFVANVLSDACRDLRIGLRNNEVSATTGLVSEEVSSAVKLLLRDVSTMGIDEQEQARIDALFTTRDFGALLVDLAVAHVLGGGAIRHEVALGRCSALLKCYGFLDARRDVVAQRIVMRLSTAVETCIQVPQVGLTGTREQREAQRNALRHLQETSDEVQQQQLAAIIQVLDADHVDVQVVDGKISQLRSAVDRVHRNITPPNVGNARTVPLMDIYVPPRVRVTQQDLESVTRNVRGDAVSVRRTVERESSWNLANSLRGLLEEHPRAVFLGNPGAGKSTLASFVAHSVATKAELRTRVHIALPVILREHASANTGAQSGLDVINSIRATCAQRYQVELTRAEVEFLCLTGRLLLILDGLDELVEVTDRINTSQSINTFAAAYKRCPILATSRVVGYTQASLNSDLFALGTVDAFETKQVRDYVHKWFFVDGSHDSFALETLVAAFMTDSETVPELRSNPLVLALLCSLYRHQRHLPRNRPAVYAECAKLLFRTWDEHRRLRPKFDFDAHVDGTVQHLADWIFGDQALQAGIPRSKLVDVAADYLDEWQYRNRPQADLAADEFIAFCTGRAWILSDVGQLRSGEPLYAFTHRSFMEYFAARHLKRAYDNDRIVAILTDKCRLSAWNMVCLMLLQLASDKSQGLEDRSAVAICGVMSQLVPDERVIATQLCREALIAVPFRPDTVTAILDQTLKYYLARLATAATGGANRYGKVDGREVYWPDSRVIAQENRRSAGVTIERDILLFAKDPGTRRLEKALVHLIDYFLVAGTTPNEIASIGDEEFRWDVAQLDTEEPFLEACALLMGIRPQGEPPLHFFRGIDGALTGTRSGWGNAELPHLFEIVIWRAAHASSTDIAFLDFIGDRFAPDWHLPRSTTGPAPEFQPHPLWLELDVTPPVSLVRLPTFIWIAAMHVAETYLEAALPNMTEFDRRLDALLARGWGHLADLPTMLALRHGLEVDRELSPAVVDQLAAVGADMWWVASDFSVRTIRAEDLWPADTNSR